MDARSHSIPREETPPLLLAVGVTLFALGVFVLLAWGEKASLLQFLYPATVLISGGLLYIARPVLYISFMWWIWFLTPFVRRIVDYQLGSFTSVSLVMLTPYLLAAFTLFTFLRYGAYLRQRRYFPFALAMLGILYGYVIGIVRSGILGPTFDLLEWLLPVLIGFHVLVYWREYPAFRRVIRSTFTWGVLVMGIYGIIQYIVAPAWDMFWLTESGMTSSMGRARPYGFRVFSTLNSTGPFSMIIMAGLLLLFDGKGLLARIAAVPGYVSFLLTLVRSAWGGWMVGLGFLIMRLRNQLRARLIAVLAVGFILSLPLLLFAPIADRVEGRVSSISNLEEDNSFRARMQLYRGAAGKAFLNPIGEGLGSIGRSTRLQKDGGIVSFDSGVLAVPLILGWPGALLFGGAFLMLLRNIIYIREERTDQFAVIAASIALAYLVMMLFANQVLGLKGVVVWTFISLAIAAQWYYRESEGI